VSIEGALTGPKLKEEDAAGIDRISAEHEFDATGLTSGLSHYVMASSKIFLSPVGLDLERP
jgi:hypothetical protein